MNPFVHTCISPHGFEIIPNLDVANHPGILRLRQALEKQGKRMEEAKPDALVVLTPHGLRIADHFSVGVSEWMRGSSEYEGKQVMMEQKVHRSLARSISSKAAEQRLPVAAVNFATAEGPLSSLPLDWGSMVPLWFMPDVPIVVITPSRDVSVDMHLQFGNTLADVVSQSKLRVGLIVSCDWAHTHEATGPYGYSETARHLDKEVQERIQSGDWERLAQFDRDFVEAAKPDGISQMLIAAGAISREERSLDAFTYECPTYFGMLVAGLARPKAPVL